MAARAQPGFLGAFFGATAGASEGRFTLEELRRLHAVLLDNKTVNGGSQGTYLPVQPPSSGSIFCKAYVKQNAGVIKL